MINTGVPEGWFIGKLGDLGKWSSGGTPSSKVQKYYNGPIPWVVTGDLADGPLQKISNSITEEGLQNSSAKLFPRGTLLVAMYGATIGKLGVLTAQAATNQACAALIPSPESSEIIPYVFHFLFSHREKLRKLGQGGAQPNISQTLLKEVKIPIAPLNEQKRIVDKIERLFSNLDEGEALLKQVQKQLATYRQSVLKAAVTGELTKDWREANKDRLESGEALLQRILKSRRENWQGRGKYQEPMPPDTFSLPELPQEWRWVSIDQVLSEGLSNGRSVPDAIDGFPVLRLTALKNGIIDTSERKIGAWSRENAEPYLVQIGDFLISRGNGSKHLVGRGGLVSTMPDSVAYPDTLIRIRTSIEYCDRKFLVYIWNSFFVRQQIETKAKTTAGIYKINQKDVCSFVLPLPVKSEQDEIVQRLDDIFSQIDALENWCATELTRSATLRQSILKDAFSGKLVPQNPADEPASELLKRILAAKAAIKRPSVRKKSRVRSAHKE